MQTRTGQPDNQRSRRAKQAVSVSTTLPTSFVLVYAFSFFLFTAVRVSTLAFDVLMSFSFVRFFYICCCLDFRFCVRFLSL
jgi:hypothetical protein